MQHSTDATQNTVGHSRKRGQKSAPAPGKKTPKKLQHLPPLSLSNIFTRLKPEFPVQRRRRSTKASSAARRSSPDTDTKVADSTSSPIEDEEAVNASFQANVYENTPANATEVGQASQVPYFPPLLPGHNIYHDGSVDSLPGPGHQDPSHSPPNFFHAPPLVEHHHPSIGTMSEMDQFPFSDNDNPGFDFTFAQTPDVDQHRHLGDLAELAHSSYPSYPMGMESPELYYSMVSDPQFPTGGGQFDRSPFHQRRQV